MKNWKDCKNILVIRLDNMGDVLMNNAALQQLKQHYPHSKITLLTSSVAAPIVPFLGTVDDLLIFDSPWMKVDSPHPQDELLRLVHTLKKRQFDGCIMFSVYSQNIFPAALLAYLSEIPLRAGYARENPYQLLTHWYPDPEPLSKIEHQIQRDLHLLEALGLQPDLESLPALQSTAKLFPSGSPLPTEVTPYTYTLLHLEVSETKRQYPVERARQLVRQLLHAGEKILFTGQRKSAYSAACLADLSTEKLLDLRGSTNIRQLAYLVEHAKGVICVNTGIMHMACAYERPTLVLYARTNLQHLPWHKNAKYILFDPPARLQSKNQIIAFATKQSAAAPHPAPSGKELVSLYKALLQATAGNPPLASNS